MAACLSNTLADLSHERRKVAEQADALEQQADEIEHELTRVPFWPSDDWLGDGGAGYDCPTEYEILPYALLSVQARAWVKMQDHRFTVFYSQSIFKWAATIGITRRLLEVAQASLSGVGSSTEEDLLEKAVAAGDDVLYPYLGDGRLKIGDRIRLGEEEEEHTIVSLGKPTRTEPGRKGGGAGFNLLKAYSSITLARPLGLPHRAGTTIVRVVEALPLRAVWSGGASGGGSAASQAQCQAEAEAEARARQVFAPEPVWVPGLGEARWSVVPWLGCRCSWPCTQLCWLSACACGASQHLAALFTLVTLLFELILLDALASQTPLASSG